MTTLPNTGVTLPTRGPSGSGHWSDSLDANWMNYDAHNHQNGKGLPINSAALAIDGDVSFGSQWAITNMQRVSFAAVTALSANNKSIFVSSADNELYWRTNTGANVKLTSGSTLNVGAFVGGIGGDYTSVGAQLNFDDGGKRYTLKEGTADSNGWAKIACGGIRLAEFNTTETLYVEQLAPAGLASTYTMTWPVALPATTNPMFVDNTGQISFPTNVTLPGSLTVTANQNITISGTGEIKHGNQTLTLPANIGSANTGTFASGANGDVQCTSAGTWVIPIPLLTGDRVQSAVIGVIGDGAVDLVVNVVYVTKLAAASTKATVTITNAPASWNDSTATAGAPAALAAGEVCVITVAPNASGSVFNNIRVVYDRP